jgi:hypothetical protein
LSGEYEINYLPSAIVIDQQGLIAGYGSFGEMAKKARKLAKQAHCSE